jgi:hypothetical protein
MVDARFDFLEVEGETVRLLGRLLIGCQRAGADSRRDRRDGERTAQKVAPVEASGDDLAHREILRRVHSDIA